MELSEFTSEQQDNRMDVTFDVQWVIYGNTIQPHDQNPAGNLTPKPYLNDSSSGSETIGYGEDDISDENSDENYQTGFGFNGHYIEQKTDFLEQLVHDTTEFGINGYYLEQKTAFLEAVSGDDRQFGPAPLSQFHLLPKSLRQSAQVDGRTSPDISLPDISFEDIDGEQMVSEAERLNMSF